MNRPHSRDKRVVNKSVRVVKKEVDNNQNSKKKSSILNTIFGLIKK